MNSKVQEFFKVSIEDKFLKMEDHSEVWQKWIRKKIGKRIYKNSKMEIKNTKKCYTIKFLIVKIRFNYNFINK